MIKYKMYVLKWRFHLLSEKKTLIAIKSRNYLNKNLPDKES